MSLLCPISIEVPPAIPQIDVNDTRLPFHLSVTLRFQLWTAEALYDPTSPTFHKWMTDADLKTYAPTDAQLEPRSDRRGVFFAASGWGAIGEVGRPAALQAT